MKTKIKSLLVSILLGSTSIAQIPTSGLIGQWLFTGNANDDSGNSNNGTVYGASLTTDRFGNLNSAYSFNGTTNYISIPSTSTLTTFTNGQSISVWVKISVLPTNGKENIIIDKRDNSNKYYQVFLSDYGNADVAVYRYAQSGAVSSQGNNINFSSLPINQWFNLTYTTDLTTTKCYLNGVLFNTFVAYSTIASNSNPLLIGKSNQSFSSDSPFAGSLDDIRIYDRELSQNEVLAIYNGCTNPIATITPQSSTTFCSGGSVVLNTTIGTNFTYEWYNNSNLIANANSSSYSTNLAGNYTVKITDGVCDSTSSSTVVIVNQNPTVNLPSIGQFNEINASSITLAGSPSGGTYSGNGVSGNIFTPLIAGLGTQTITYDYTNSNNCSGSASQNTIVYDTTGIVCTSYDTTFITVTDTLLINVQFAGLNNATGTTTIKIYPNPTSDIIYINTGDYTNLSGSSVKITNSVGQSVFTSLINQQLFTINTTQFGAKGVYTVQIIDGNQNIQETRNIVLQ